MFMIRMTSIDYCLCIELGVGVADQTIVSLGLGQALGSTNEWSRSLRLPWAWANVLNRRFRGRYPQRPGEAIDTIVTVNVLLLGFGCLKTADNGRSSWRTISSSHHSKTRTLKRLKNTAWRNLSFVMTLR